MDEILMIISHTSSDLALGCALGAMDCKDLLCWKHGTGQVYLQSQYVRDDSYQVLKIC